MPTGIEIKGTKHKKEEEDLFKFVDIHEEYADVDRRLQDKKQEDS